MKNNNPSGALYTTIIVAMVVSIVGTCWGIIHIFQGELFKIEIEEMKEVTSTSSNQLTLLLSEYTLDLSALSIDADVKEFASGDTAFAKEVNNKIEIMKGKRDEVTIYLMDSTGQVRASTDSRFIGNNYGFSSYFTTALTHPIAYEAAVGKTSNELGIYISKAVRDLSGSVQGVVVIKLNPSVLKFDPNDKYSYFVTDEFGVILYSTNESEVMSSLVDFSLYDTEKQREIKSRYPNLLRENVRTTELFSSIFMEQKSQGVVLLDHTIFGERNIVTFESKEGVPLYILLTSNRNALMLAYARVQNLILFAIIGAFLIPSIIIFLKIHSLFRTFSEVEESAHQLTESVEKNNTLSIPFLPNLTRAIQELYAIVNKQHIAAEQSVSRIKKKLKDTESELTLQQAAILNVLEDVDESKNEAIQLASDLEKFKLAVDGVTDLVSITDSNGKVIYTNPISKKMTGFNVEEAVGKSLGELWGGNMDKKYYKSMWNTIQAEKKPFKGVVSNKRKDGSVFIAQLQISPLLDNSGTVKFFVGVQRDITREVKVDRMKTDFISLASHQLRTPLSGIKWYVEMLLDGDLGELSKKQIAHVNDIYESSKRMIDLVNALLNVSRMDSGRIIVNPQKTEIQKLLKGVMKGVEIPLSKKKQTVKLQVHKDIPTVLLDQKLIRNVYMNLLSNAIKYSPEKTTIHVEIFVKGDDLVSSVSDEGYGIPHADHDHIFQKFFRAANTAQHDTDGNGLGLYLVKSIIESSEGTIWFKSRTVEEDKKNHGTTFTFTLPLKGMKKKEGEVHIQD